MTGKKNLSCLHTHTSFCDGNADIETMCEAAYAKGLCSIGFSSHAPIAKKTGMVTDWHMGDHKLNEYIDAVEAAKKRWKGRLAVFLGLEVDYIKGHCGPADPDIQALPLDFIIGSIHFLFSPINGKPFNMDEYPEDFCNNVLALFDNDGRALVETYYDAYNSMISAGGSDILGHIDLVKKNNGPHHFFSSGDSWYRESLAKTADLIAACRTNAEKTGSRVPAVEVNTGAVVRGYIAEPYPSAYMLALLAGRNIPLVLNADAHAPEYLDGSYGEALQFMKDAGCAAMALFEGRQGGKALWREVVL